VVSGERVEGGGLGEGRVVVVGEVEEVFNSEVVSDGGAGVRGRCVVGGELRIEGIVEELLCFHGFWLLWWVEGKLRRG